MTTGNLRQSMSSLHTWSGLLLGWLLYVMFVCGTIAYFQDEITRWMQPEVAPARDQAEAVAGAQAWLEQNARDAQSWFITPPGRRSAVTSVYWVPAKPGGDQRTSATLDGRGREVAARATAGGFFLYRMHFDLHYLPVIWARYIVGIAAMFMLVAIISGIITHKKIFADFFMLRFGKGQRSWLDAHNVSAVLALPFHLMITYTGLVSLASLYAPAPMIAAFGNEDAYYAAAFPQGGDLVASKARMPLAPLDAIVARAARTFGAREIGYLYVQLPGDRNARVAVTSSPAAGFDTRGETLVFDGTTGRQRAPLSQRGAAQVTESVMIGLHAGRYAGLELRWLYFISGVFGTVMVATGLVLWTAKRRMRLSDPARPPLGFRIVERLNIGTIAGFPLGIAGYFLANRLLPVALADRPDREIAALFLSWGAAAFWALIRPPQRGWRELAAGAALAFAAVPLASLLTVGPSWSLAARYGSPIYPAVDGAMAAAAVVAALVARHKRTVRANVRRLSS
ncbi:PepSY domain-containing protein [Sphingomonas sp. CL5.1]|uniref:PepSY-associated TM helix domain-containing protein n=1 Tax=Sphingomonas sp. CL5.1 TaxID=2653203 RepID=UPI001583D3C6|nr:PepSY-associated TM helix domain-containing protein [Sphingomonas sp. CL5.1]QKR98375.1 PepSY domain-containing protein [Sphingomonas sp. CL5.1]